MRVLNDYVCTTCGLRSEHYIDHEIRSVRCECGGEALKAMATPTVRLDGTSGDFPTAYDRWATIREQRHRKLARSKE